MIVTPNTKTVTTYTMELSESDAAECLSAPYEFAERIGQQLQAAGLQPASNGNSRKPHKVGRDHQLGFLAQTRRARAAKAVRSTPKGLRRAAKGRKPAPTAGNSLEPLQCPHCPKQIARKYLANHIRKVHGIEPQTNGASQEAAPAAV